METVNKLCDRFYKIIEMLCVLFFAGMVVTVSYVVFGRYVLNSTPRWGEEVALFCMVWFALLSASLAINDERHIRVAIWDEFLPAKAVKILHIIIHVILFGIIILMLQQGIQLFSMVAGSKMAGTGISFKYLYGAVPVSSVCMLVFTIRKVGDIIGSRS